MSNSTQDSDESLDAVIESANFTQNKCGDSDDSSQCSQIRTHPNNDETNSKEAYQKSSLNRIQNKENLKIALHNVLELAVEQLNSYSKDWVKANKIIAEQSKQSIEMVRKYRESIQDSNVILAQQDKQ